MTHAVRQRSCLEQILSLIGDNNNNNFKSYLEARCSHLKSSIDIQEINGQIAKQKKKFVTNEVNAILTHELTDYVDKKD